MRFYIFAFALKLIALFCSFRVQSAAISNSSECCISYDYSASFGSCVNAANPTLRGAWLPDLLLALRINLSYFICISDPVSCQQCLSYQCIDWTMGSRRIVKQEAFYKARTQQDVYFGVGSLGSNKSYAGLCYRIGLYQLAKDIIVQVVDRSL